MGCGASSPTPSNASSAPAAVIGTGAAPRVAPASPEVEVRTSPGHGGPGPAGSPPTTVKATPVIPVAVPEARTKTPFSDHAHEASTATVTGLAWVCGADELRKLSALEDATSVAQLAGLCGLLREAAAAPAGSDAPRLALELPVVQRQFGGDVSKALEAAREACRAALELFAEKAIPSPAELADACAVVLSGDAELSRSLLDVLLSLRRSTVLARVPPARVGALVGVLGRLPRGTLTSTDRARLVEFCAEQLRGVEAASPGDVDALASLRLVPAALAAVEAAAAAPASTQTAPALSYEGAAKELDALLRSFEGCGWWRAEAAASFARQALAAASSDYDPLQNALGRAKALGRVVYKLYRAGKVVFDGVSSFGVTTAMELVAAAKEAAGSVDGAGVLEDVREFWADLRQLVGADDLQGKKCWYRRARLVAALAEGGHLAELEAELEAGALAEAAARPEAAAALCAALFAVAEADGGAGRWRAGPSSGWSGSRRRRRRRSAAGCGGRRASSDGRRRPREPRGAARRQRGGAAAAAAALQRMRAGGGAAGRAADASAEKYLGVPAAEEARPAPRFPKALGAIAAPRGSRGPHPAPRASFPPRPSLAGLAQYAKTEVGDKDAAQALALYVHPKATTDAARRNVVDLAGHVAAFLRRHLPARGGAESAGAAPAALAAAGARVLLIAGEPGSSKSTFLAFLHRRACEQWAGADGRPPAGDDRLPVTCLLRLSNLTRERAASGLRAEAARVLGLPEADLSTLRDSRGLVLLLDAYDELETGAARPPALWSGNELGKWASAVVITCRSAYLAAQPDYPSLFALGGDRGALEEICTHPFDAGQVKDYIHKYIGLYGPSAAEGLRDPDCTWTVEEYAARIAQVPGTATLIENPFTLTMVVKSLPKILKSREAAHSENPPAKAAATYLLTIRELYQQFVELWFKRQWEEKLTLKETGDMKDWTLSDFQEYSRGYCKDLADAMFRAAVSEVLCPPKKAKGAQYVPRGAKAADATAAAPAEGAQGADRDLRLCIELLTDTSDPVLAFCRDNCPLRVARAADGGTAVRFLHKTLLEYFVAEGAYAEGANAFRSAIEGEAAPQEERARPQAKLQALRRVQSIADGSAAVVRANPSLLHLRLLTKEPKILQFIADCCTTDIDYRNNLLELIERSRREDATPGDITASANAMTILNRAGYSFAGSSLRRVRVPGADLQRLEAVEADLRGADLTGCSLLDANLARADLRGAVLTDCSVTLNPALRGHEGFVRAVAITRDGKRAVSGSADKTLRVWDLESGAELRRFAGHEIGVTSVAISPDGKRAVSGSADKTLRVWDLESGEELRRLAGHEGQVNSVAISLDGKRAVSGSDDKTLRVWDLESGAELRRLAGHEKAVHSVAILPDGKRAVSGGADQTLRVWDLESGAELRRLAGHNDSVTSVAISPDGKRAVSGSFDETLRVWDLESGAELRRLGIAVQGYLAAVWSVAISPDGKLAVSGSNDNTLRVWDLESGAELRRLPGHGRLDGKRAVSGSFDETLRVWDLESGAELRRLAGHEAEVNSVAISLDGKRAVSGSGDNTLRVWDLESGAELRRLAGHESGVTSVAISPDGKRAVSGSEDNTLRVWDLESGAELRRLAGHDGWVTSVAISADGKRAVSGSHYKTLRVWDLESGMRTKLRCLGGHEDQLTSVAISPDGKRAVSGSRDRTMRVWDLESGVELRHLKGHKFWAQSVAISLDGKRAVSGGADQTLRVWDLEGGAELRCLAGHKETVTSVAISPDGKFAVSGGDDKTLRVWDLESGAELRCLAGHEHEVKSVATSLDGKRAVSGSHDNMLRVWDLSSGAELARTEFPRPSTYDQVEFKLVFSKDAAALRIHSRTGEGAAYVWRWQSAVLTRVDKEQGLQSEESGGSEWAERENGDREPTASSIAVAEGALGGRGLIAVGRPDGTITVSTLPHVFCARRIGTNRAQEFRGCKYDGATVMSGKLALLLEQEGGVRLEAGEGGAGEGGGEGPEPAVRLWLPVKDE
eukprot:tig00021070_g17936.t2